MKFPEDIQKQLLRKYKTKKREWLESSTNKHDTHENQWPFEIKLGIPTESQAKKQLADVRVWVETWQSWNGVGDLIWSEKHWRTLGTQRVPEKIVFSDPSDVAKWIDETERWEKAKQRYCDFINRWPMLSSKLPRYYDLLADYSEVDYQRLLDMITWISLNPYSNLYIRQLPVPGLDSKWLEGRKGVLTDLIGEIKGEDSSNVGFFQLCGLKIPPQLIRIRILDHELRKKIGGLGDISAPVEQLAKLDIPVKNIFIVENLQTGLAFNDLPESIVIMQLGYAVDVLGNLPWVTKANCIYWGDLDTHGFAILSRARTYFPHLSSVMMDEETLHNHQELWVEEPVQHGAETLPMLNDKEQVVYNGIKHNVWGQNIRLEQERISWDYAWNKLRRILV